MIGGLCVGDMCNVERGGTLKGVRTDSRRPHLDIVASGLPSVPPGSVDKLGGGLTHHVQ